MKHPTFIVAGFAKCGTTSLCANLASHPDLFITDPKEPHYFSYSFGEEGKSSWYASLFADANATVATGEGSTSYTHPDSCEASAAHISETVPDCRLIFMVRNPIDRLVSDWKMRLHEGWAPASIERAIEQNPTLITLGLYWSRLQAYLKHFDAAQIHIAFLEDYATRPEDVIRDCLSHVGIDTVHHHSKQIALNTAATKRQPTPLLRLVINRPLFKSLTRHIPGALRRIGKAALTRPIHQNLTDETRAQLATRFADDSHQILDYCGKPNGFWSRDS